MITGNSTQVAADNVAVPPLFTNNGEQIPESYLAKFNWGALLFHWWWTLWNADSKLKWIAIGCQLASFFTLGIPSLVVAVYLGLKGNRIAARCRTFQSFEQLRAVQRAWAAWGIGLLLITVPIFIALSIFSAYVHASTRGY